MTNPIPILLESPNGRDLWVRFGSFSLTPAEASEFASALMGESNYARRLPDIHQNHVNLQASCALCRGEAGAQTDRLTYEDGEPPYARSLSHMNGACGISEAHSDEDHEA